MKLIILRGYPGSGKTTVGRLFAQQGLGSFIDHNAVLNKLVGRDGTDDGRYEEIHQQEQVLTRQALQVGQDTLIARGFTIRSQVEPYLKLAEETGASVHVFRLEVPSAVLAERVTADSRSMDAMSLKTPKELGEWMAAHPMEPLQQEIELNGTEPPEALVEEIRSRI